MTRVWSEHSSLRALLCIGVRLGFTFRGWLILLFLLTLSAHAQRVTVVVESVCNA